VATHAAPPTKYADALERAWRTFLQAILLDAAAAIGGGILTLMGTLDVSTGAFWTAVFWLVVKSVLLSGASYLHRLVKEPSGK
jgi:hypothetical protein